MRSGVARRAMERAMVGGDHLAAYDIAVEAVADQPDDVELRYLLVLSLARSGAFERAQVEYDRLQELARAAPKLDDGLREDIATFGARLTKDRALVAPGSARGSLAALASDQYERIHREQTSPYACVNAATLALVAGDHERAAALAREALTALNGARTVRESDDYWFAATAAEASLLCGEITAAREALLRARRCRPTTGMIATTRRQLRLACAELALDAEVLDVLALPAVLHFAGHIAHGPADDRFGPSTEARVVAALSECAGAEGVGWAFGSLAAGADIVVAELALLAGAELHVMLPFRAADFEAVSVAPAGDAWLQRFRACLAHATSVSLVSDSGHTGHDSAFAHCSRVAIGRAIERARSLGVDPVQVALWDGTAPKRAHSTAREIELWRSLGHVSTTVEIPATAGPHARVTSAAPREVRALLFADLKGSSRLFDEHFDALVGHVLGELARVLDTYDEAVLQRLSWGDAVQAVFTDVVTASRCALDLQRAMHDLDLVSHGLPADLGLRVSVHAGPVVALKDPIRGEPGYFGRGVRTARRIEPRTPEGSVYVTEFVAALLALEPGADLRVEYVGRITTAKDFETIPMYVLLHV